MNHAQCIKKLSRNFRDNVHILSNSTSAYIKKVARYTSKPFAKQLFDLFYGQQ